MPIRRCPGCKLDLEIPAGTAPGRKIRCPECDETFLLPGPKPAATATMPRPSGPLPQKFSEAAAPKPVKKPIPVSEVIEEDEKSRRKRPKKKKKVAARDVPFWKTRTGMILNGLGLIALGLTGAAVAYFSDSRKQVGIYIAGAIAIFLGIGTIGNGLMGATEDAEPDNDDDEE